METSSSLPELLRDPRATRDFHTCYVRHLDTVNDAVMEAARRLPMVARLLATATPEQLAESQATSLQQLERALLHADWEPTFVRQRREGATYAAMGVPFQEWFELCTAFERCLVPELIADLGGDPQRLAAAIGAMGAYVDLALRTLGEEYLRTKERIINQQQEAIQELSTPVLKLADRLLLVPLVGLIDTQSWRRSPTRSWRSSGATSPTGWAGSGRARW